MQTLCTRPLGGKRRSASRGQGFSLIELVICIGILTTGIIFMVGIFTTMMHASTKGADWSVATYIAASQLDQLVAQPNKISSIYNGEIANHAAPMAYHAGAGEPAAVASVNNTTYYVTYTVKKLNNPQTPAGTSKQLYDVDCLVQWFGPNPADSAGPSAGGYGKLSMHLSRMIYVH